MTTPVFHARKLRNVELKPCTPMVYADYRDPKTPATRPHSQIGSDLWVSPVNRCDGPENGPKMVQKLRKSIHQNGLRLWTMTQYAPDQRPNAIVTADVVRGASQTFFVITNG